MNRPPVGRRRVTAVAAGLLAAVLAAGGCGVPTSSEVQYVGPGPVSGAASPGDGGQPPPHADQAAGPGEQVDNFLQAAAGSPATAVDRVREYIHSDHRASWQPAENIRVIRLLQEPYVNDLVDGGWLVEVRAQVVGDLHNPLGYLDAPTVVEPVDYQFRVMAEGGPEGEVSGQSTRLRIAEPPSQLLLLDTALANEDYFFPHPIYFWDADRDRLVPDLRWLPLAGEPTDQQPWTVVQWLLAGPAPGLPRIEGLPAGSAHIGTPVWEGDRLVVNFNAAVLEGTQPDELATQLARSLLRLRGGAVELELRIDDRPQPVGIRPPPDVAEPARFVVLDGVVHSYGERSVQPAVLTDEVNAGVWSAALTASGELAALVREEADGQRRLSVVSAPAGTDPTEHATDLADPQLGRPVWVNSGGHPVGLVVADGELYRFTRDGEVAQVTISGLAGPVTEVAVAPEERRLALIAGGRLYLAQLRLDAESVTVQAPRALATTVRQLAGVAFTHENWLVVAGVVDDRVWLNRLTVDGAVQEPMQGGDLGNAEVEGLVAHPAAGPGDPPMIMYEANGQAYTFSAVPSLIPHEEVSDAPDDPQSPPRAPFFLS